MSAFPKSAFFLSAKCLSTFQVSPGMSRIDFAVIYLTVQLGLKKMSVVFLGFRTTGGFRVKKFGLVVFWKIPNDRGIFFSGLLLFVCDRALFVIQPKKRNSSTGVEWTHRVAWKHSLYMVMMMVDSQGWVETHGGYFDIGLFRSILTLEILRDKFMQLRCKMPTKHHLVTAVCQGGTPSQGH